MFRGSLTALITPFANGEVDERALRRLVHWQIEQGTDGLVPAGTTGEASTLSEQEHRKVVATTIEACDGQVPVIAGCGSNNTREAIAYTQFAEAAGASATLHVAGYYNRPNQEGLFQHFKAIHDASTLPIIVYNIPKRAAVDILPDTLARIASLPRVVGVKDATGDLARPGLERLRIDRQFCFLSGEDATAVAYNASGGAGCISVTANVAPYLCAAVQRASLQGNYTDGMAIQDRLMPLHEALFLEPSPAGVKYAASRLGLCSAECRLPIVPITAKTCASIESAMRRLHLGVEPNGDSGDTRWKMDDQSLQRPSNGESLSSTRN